MHHHNAIFLKKKIVLIIREHGVCLYIYQCDNFYFVVHITSPRHLPTAAIAATTTTTKMMMMSAFRVYTNMKNSVWYFQSSHSMEIKVIPSTRVWCMNECIKHLSGIKIGEFSCCFSRIKYMNTIIITRKSILNDKHYTNREKMRCNYSKNVLITLNVLTYYTICVCADCLVLIKFQVKSDFIPNAHAWKMLIFHHLLIENRSKYANQLQRSIHTFFSLNGSWSSVIVWLV